MNKDIPDYCKVKFRERERNRRFIEAIERIRKMQKSKIKMDWGEENE